MELERRLGVWEKHGLWLIAVAVAAGLHVISMHNYLVFHTIVEVFAIVVACGIFMLAWNSRRVSQNDYLLFLGVAYLFVGGLDLVHTLAYEGVGIFERRGSNLATQLWIGARFVESLSLLLAPLLAPRHLRAGWVFACFIGVTVCLLVSTLYWPIFPVCFDGDGLTLFKKVSEYVISGMLVVSIVLLLRRRARFDRVVLRLIVASIVLTIASELSFTLYRDVYGITNELGHLLKLFSFYLIYRAVIQTGIRKPYAVLLRDLKKSNESLELKNRELQRFASIIRHDLGNPLFSVEALAKCIENYCSQARDTFVAGRLDRKRKDEVLAILKGDIPRSVESIQESIGLMKHLLEGLRQVAAVGHRPLHISCVDMNALLGRITEAMAPKAASGGVSLSVDDLPACQGDLVQLSEVFGNLLDNAVKYLDPERVGRIRVSGWCEADASVYCVEDNGLGIADEQQERVFEIFHRIDPNGRVDGEGLGLSIVRRLVERHNGRIWLESELGKGSKFFVALPNA